MLRSFRSVTSHAVDVKVAGKVNAGDYIVTSDIAGIGKADNNPTNIAHPTKI